LPYDYDLISEIRWYQYLSNKVKLKNLIKHENNHPATLIFIQPAIFLFTDILDCSRF